jgi:uncharacterized protein (TIGR03435 family)
MRLSCRLVATIFLCCAGLSAQTPKLEFEAASVRMSDPLDPNHPAQGVMMGGPETSDPTRIIFSAVPLLKIVMAAFDVDQDRIRAEGLTLRVPTPIRGTDRVSDLTPRYDLVATVAPGTTRDQANEMLRNLLLDRFKMTYHLEPKDFPIYEAVVATGPEARRASKLKPAEAATETCAPAKAEPGATSFPMGPDGFPELPAGQPAMAANFGQKTGRVRLTARMMPVASLLNVLGGGYIVDRTGLTGTYDFKLEYPLSGDALIEVQDLKTDGATLSGVPARMRGNAKPSHGLVVAVEEQLGLKLQKGRAPLDVVVIDHIETVPTDN